MSLTQEEEVCLALDLARFLKELQSITDVSNPPLPGPHNFMRGAHSSVYDQDARGQISRLANIIDSAKALELWNMACQSQWGKPPVWIHGDLAIGNILMENGKLSAIIDWGGLAIGDPACDLVLTWTYFSKKAGAVFVHELNLDAQTWSRAKGWALWKATFELLSVEDKNSDYATLQKLIIGNLI